MKQKTLHTQGIILWSSMLVFPTLLCAANTNEMSLFTGVNLLILLLGLLTFFLIYKVKKNATTLDKLRKELKHLSRTDDLTQMFNRRYLEKRLYEVFERHIRNKSSNLSLIHI